MPTLTAIHPAAALPGGDVELIGTDLGRSLRPRSPEFPRWSRWRGRPAATIRVPEGTLPGDLIVSRGGVESNPLTMNVAVAMAENLHPVANPAVDEHGNVYATLSGSRGQQTPVSVFRIAPAPAGVIHELRPFAREILNASGLAFGPDGLLYVSSRAEGIVYRVGHTGIPQVYAEGLGIATGIAFDAEGDLYVGDRSGTIFKIRTPSATDSQEDLRLLHAGAVDCGVSSGVRQQGDFVCHGPTTASNQVIHAIDRNGEASVFYSGLGRAQGMAFDAEDNMYVAASLAGDRGIIRISPSGEAKLVIAGSNLVGLCLLSGNRVALATREAFLRFRCEAPLLLFELKSS